MLRLPEPPGLPLRERNYLLLKAGYAPAYPEQALDSAELAPVMDALGHRRTGRPPGTWASPSRSSYAPRTSC